MTELVFRSPAEPLIGMRGVGVSRAGRWLVRGVDLSIRRGEIVTLIGPNGSGKTTTAKTAVGILKPDAGHVDRARDLVVGYVPQKLSVDRSLPMSVARMMRLTTRVDADAIEAALERVGIAHLAKAQVHELSGGEFQRALLARAMLRRPDLLVLDEPVQGVDFSGEIALYELISELRDNEGCAVLLISHDLHVVMAKTDRVICLNGHVCCEGSPSSVAASPAYRQLFGDRAAEALAVYRHRHDHTHLPGGEISYAHHDDDGASHRHGDAQGHRHGDAPCDHAHATTPDTGDADEAAARAVEHHHA